MSTMACGFAESSPLLRNLLCGDRLLLLLGGRIVLCLVLVCLAALSLRTLVTHLYLHSRSGAAATATVLAAADRRQAKMLIFSAE